MRGRRVVVTGLGTINSLGHDTPTTWEKISAGQSGIGPITHFDATDYKTQIGGEVKDFDPESLFGRKEARRLDRVAQYALKAADEALRDAKLEQLSPATREEIGVVLGNGMGGISTTLDAAETLLTRGPSRISPFFIPMMLSDSIPAHISMTFNLRGPNMSIATACASATNAIGEAARMVSEGVRDIMVTGGAETAVVPISIAGFNAMHAMSTWNDRPQEACRPFDLERNGFVPADGAAILVVETLEHAQARGAHIYGEILGYGSSADAYHISAPLEDGAGALLSVKMALDMAGITPDDIEYVNAHGTSTTLNDAMETAVHQQVFGAQAPQVPISSSKSMHGHTLGAAGAIELTVCLKALEAQVLPPTINYTTPDPELTLDYVPNQARPTEFSIFMSNSFGFGGHNATLIGGKV